MEGGSGYGSSPVVTIENPVSAGDNNISIGGTFIYNEVVTGSSSGTTARVKDWNGVTDVMEVGIISGTFVNGEYLTGSDSGAKYVIGGVNTDDLVTPFADNDNIETKLIKHLTQTETNPAINDSSNDETKESQNSENNIKNKEKTVNVNNTNTKN